MTDVCALDRTDLEARPGSRVGGQRAGVVRLPGMTLEHALLPVRPGTEERFIEAFGEAKQIISSMRGFRSLTLSRCIERPGTYLLLVVWDTLHDHTEGFRKSDEYQQWRRLLHHFYEPFPTVEHFEQVVRVGVTLDD
jgi:heme-degrading monooxygenase HmoA